MTRSCPACGAANEEDEDFCGSCGTYLGWSSRRARTAAPAPEVDAPARPAEETGPPEGDDAPPVPSPRPAPAPDAGRRTHSRTGRGGAAEPRDARA